MRSHKDELAPDLERAGREGGMRPHKGVWGGLGEGGVRGGLGEVVADELEERRRREPMMQTKVMPPEGKEDGLDRYFICVGTTSGSTFFIFTKLE
jgi:hypothetical protein